MNNAKKVLFTILLILIPSIAITTSVYLILKGTEEVKGVSIEPERCTPYITNMIPNIAYVDEEYSFFPKVIGCSIEEVEIGIDGVEWLSVTEDKYIYGIPEVSDIGTHKIEISVQSETGNSTLTDYIIVKENEE